MDLCVCVNEKDKNGKGTGSLSKRYLDCQIYVVSLRYRTDFFLFLIQSNTRGTENVTVKRIHTEGWTSYTLYFFPQHFMTFRFSVGSGLFTDQGCSLFFFIGNKNT
jgi:hypothetical protein